MLFKYRGGGQYDIIENYYDKKNRLSDLENRSLRWILCDKKLNEYKYVYVGDIDIYICKESESLLTQHEKHMQLIGLPYSNALRLKIGDYLRDRKGSNKKSLFRLTGLHFFRTRDWFEATEKCRNEISELLLGPQYNYNLLKRIKTRLLKKFVTIDDERLLFFIVLCSHIGLPNGSYELENNTAECFRPSHGMHFAIGREPAPYKESFSANRSVGIAQKNEAESYFESFVLDYNSSKTLQQLFKNNYYISEILLETCNFFGYKLCKDKIEKY